MGLKSSGMEVTVLISARNLLAFVMLLFGKYFFFPHLVLFLIIKTIVQHVTIMQLGGFLLRSVWASFSLSAPSAGAGN